MMPLPSRSLPALAAALLLASSALAGPPGAVGDVYITNDIDNTTRQYDGVTGVLQAPHYVSSAATGQMMLHFGETGRVLIGHSSGGVEEFNATTGAYIKTYNPGGGWQWAGIYAPNGEVYVGDHATNDVRRYDATTGALLGVLTTVDTPSDMVIGPNGNLFICSYGSAYVKEVNVDTGAFVDQWSTDPLSRPNDIAFLPSGEILVMCMGTNVCYRFDAAKNLLGSFAGTAWGRPHGIAISPHDGNIYAADGVTAQVHVFDPVTFTELDPAFLIPQSQSKIVDVVFRPEPGPVSTQPMTWGTIKAQFR